MPSYSKADICQMYSLQPRDLRKLGATGFSNILPAILVREKAILVNIEHIRAIVTASSVILFDPPQETQQHHVGFVYDLQRKLRMTNGFYEFRALEAILVNVINVIEVELEELLPKINELLEEFDGGVTPSSLSSLLNYRRQLTRLKQRVETNRDVLKQLLSASDDLASMYLMSKAMGTPRQISDDIEVELLMEHYIMMFDEMAYSVNEALNNVKSTEVVTGIVQDDHRNRLIMFELKATLCTVALSSGTFIATVFGMNIPSGLEEVNGSFATIGIVSCMISGVAMVWALRQLQGIKQSSVHIASGPHRGFPIWGGARRANSVAGIERAKILEASKDESKKLEVKPPVTPKDGKGKNLQDDKSSSTLKI
ncbi:hypothetical protein BJ742DRAFT_298745 [Cladochytrium replicatum]|nr:hypothetical protein BJ742DRAFT_298745 [Cladochytrium replicatum]